ncbi:hypothetical protein ECEC1865_1957, partial [Escherichia coli EC1865]
MFIINPY